MRFLIFIFLFVFIFIFENTHASDINETEAPLRLSEDPMRILSWNIYTLPRHILPVREGPIRRARKIAEVFLQQEYDVIVLQEAFDRRVRRIIRRKVSELYPYEYGPSNTKFFSFRTNSGIWILSRHPLKYLDEIQYEQSFGWDAWARKGALMVEVDFNGQLVHIIGTHLQSGGGKMGDTVRYSQNRQIREELLNVYSKPEIPVLLCGDFNISKANVVWYETMLEVFGARDGQFLTAQKYTADHGLNQFKSGDNRGSIIDFIFKIDDAASIERIERYIRIYRERWSRNFSELSDHFAVEAKIWFNSK